MLLELVIPSRLRWQAQHQQCSTSAGTVHTEPFPYLLATLLHTALITALPLALITMILAPGERGPSLIQSLKWACSECWPSAVAALPGECGAEGASWQTSRLQRLQQLNW